MCKTQVIIDHKNRHGISGSVLKWWGNHKVDYNKIRESLIYMSPIKIKRDKQTMTVKLIEKHFAIISISSLLKLLCIYAINRLHYNYMLYVVMIYRKRPKCKIAKTHIKSVQHLKLMNSLELKSQSESAISRHKSSQAFFGMTTQNS